MAAGSKDREQRQTRIAEIQAWIGNVDLARGDIAGLHDDYGNNLWLGAAE